MKTNSNFNVIQTVFDWLEQEKHVWLVTVISTWGSSPTPCGTLMAYCEANGVVGSLSGGCIEEDLLSKFKNGEIFAQLKAPSQTTQLVYGDSEEQQERFMLPCGGQLHLLVEQLKPSLSTLEHFKQLIERLACREKITRRVSLTDSGLSLSEKNVQLGIKKLSDAIEHSIGPNYQMLLIGASEVARCVAELAQPLGFKVTVWDHRKVFIQNWQVEGVEVVSGSPEKLINQNFSDTNNAIIALAHDPRVDDIALVDALATNAFYIGAIGSKFTCEKRNNRLKNYIDEENNLDKMHSPVGVDIGSKTPYEIAISILAEVISERRKLEKTLIFKL
jgi:xanthine dehydrogenase accessory factor